METLINKFNHMNTFLKIVLLILFPAIAFAQGTCAQQTYTVCKVQTLADSGTNSLRDCLTRSGKRVVVFEISGRIKLLTPIKITNPDFYIAGQTAPGIVMVTNSGIYVKASNGVLEHFAIRPGDEAIGEAHSNRDALRIEAPNSTTTISNIKVKNMSISFAEDENFSTYLNATDVLVSNTIISEALHRAKHGEGPHSMGALIGEKARRITFDKNLFAHNNDRNVRWKYDTTGELINNLVYNWGGATSWNTNNVSKDGGSAPTFLDMIGNHYIAGPNSFQLANCLFASNGSPANSTKIYVNDNICPTRPTGLFPQWSISNFAENPYRSLNRVVANTVNGILQSSEVFNEVLSNAGARPWCRDEIDSRVISTILDGNGSIVDCVENCDSGDIKAGNGFPNIPTLTRSLDTAIEYTEGELSTYLYQFIGQCSNVQETPTPSPVPTLTPTIIPTSAQTAIPTMTPVVTSIPTQTFTPSPVPTMTPTRTATPSPSATSSSVCTTKINTCKNTCEDCQRYFNNKISAHPFNPLLSCEEQLNICKLFCESC